MVPPELGLEYEDWLDAFWELGTERSFGGLKPGPIPWTALERYSRRYPEHEREVFRVVMRRLDQVFMTRDTGETFTRENLGRAGKGGF